MLYLIYVDCSFIESLLATLLKNDAISTPLVFRITVISIFAATDGWRVNDDGSEFPEEFSQVGQSQTTVHTRSCVFGWILLLSLMSCVRYMTISSSIDYQIFLHSSPSFQR